MLIVLVWSGIDPLPVQLGPNSIETNDAHAKDLPGALLVRDLSAARW